MQAIRIIFSNKNASQLLCFNDNCSAQMEMKNRSVKICDRIMKNESTISETNN